MDELGATFVNYLDEGNIPAAAEVASKVMALIAERDMLNYADCYPVAHDRLVEALQDYCLWMWKPGREDYRAQFMEAITEGMDLYLKTDHPAKMKVLEELSRGQKALREVIAKALPDHEIRDEEPIGNLFMDIFVPGLNLCVEYDGRQHYEFTPHFHATEDDFQRQQFNDKRKEQLCKKQGIRLVRVRYDEPATMETVLSKLFMEGGFSRAGSVPNN